MDLDQLLLPLVIDNGTQTTKVGFGGDDTPRAVIITVVGRSRHPGIMVGMGLKDSYVGEEALNTRRMLRYTYPIENGIVTNWEDVESIWHHIFDNELRVAPEGHPVLLTESISNSKANREKTTEIMFETFNTPAMYLVSDQLLSLCASGRQTGTVVKMGYYSCSCCNIIDGKIDQRTLASFNIGGDGLTNLFKDLLEAKGYSFTTRHEMEVVEDIKEKMCYVCLDFDKEINKLSELNSSIKKEYELPDGQMIYADQERFLTPELFFKKKEEILKFAKYKKETIEHIVKGKPLKKTNKKKNKNDIENINEKVKEYPSLPEMLFESISNCSTGIKTDLYENIVISGGSSLFRGLKERIAQELSLFWAESPPTIKVIAPEERKYSAWIGGSIMTTLSTMKNKWMTKDEYNERGPSFVNDKCNHFL
ncbi:actin-7-related [Anaeramoeba flamelloides]|uniref:Actin-7-related n=1 Tax=Anaeramoeba flamelloides TaxID=1746091 RepID=A0ABQ8ZFL4_9EUKA|nr:actin-7-related [Anaeramoeba flamelloides]